VARRTPATMRQRGSCWIFEVVLTPYAFGMLAPGSETWSG
jgi:hypothetical protein